MTDQHAAAKRLLLGVIDDFLTRSGRVPSLADLREHVASGDWTEGNKAEALALIDAGWLTLGGDDDD